MAISLQKESVLILSLAPPCYVLIWIPVVPIGIISRVSRETIRPLSGGLNKAN